MILQSNGNWSEGWRDEGRLVRLGENTEVSKRGEKKEKKEERSGMMA